LARWVCLNPTTTTTRVKLFPNPLLSLYCFGVEAFTATTNRGCTGGEVDSLDSVTLLSLYCFGVKAFTTTRGFSNPSAGWVITLFIYCHFIALESRPSHHQRIYRWGKGTVGPTLG
jgi:hypothetical protein